MIEINLVPDVKQELLKAQLIRTRVITGSIMIGLASVIAIALLATYVFVGQVVRNNLADDKIKTESQKLISFTDLPKKLTIQNQLTKISGLNNNKNIDSRIFDVLSAITPPYPNNIQISTLELDSTASTITIDGQAANSYAAVEVFRKTIESAKFRFTDASGTAMDIALASEISTSNTSYGEDSTGSKVLRFTMSFVYTPELFSPLSKNTSIAIAINGNGNVTDSYRGVPEFTDRAKDIVEDK